MTGQTKPLRIVIASSLYPPMLGGPATQSALFAKGFAAHGCEVRVLTHGSGSDTKTVRYIARSETRSIAASLERYRTTLRRVQAQFEDFRPDAAIVQISMGPLPAAVAVAARQRGIPSVMKIANDPLLDFKNAQVAKGERTDSTTYALRRASRWLAGVAGMRLHSFVWATTPAFSERIRARYRIPERKMIVQPNLFDLPEATPRLRADAASGRLLYAGRLQPIKGVDILLDAVANMRHPQWTLTIAGDGDPSYRQSLKDQAATLGIADRVTWVGTLSAEALYEAYRAADILAVPSRNEAFGNVIVEAMARALPVVAMAVGGTPYILQDGKAGILVEPQNSIDLARKLDALLDDPQRLSDLSAAGLARAHDFGLDEGTAEWISFFNACRSGA